MKKYIILLLFTVSIFTMAADVQINATGSGYTYREAVNEALISALEQQYGFTMDSTARTQIHVNDLTITENGSENNTAEMQDSILKESKKWSKGRINGYREVSSSCDPVTKQYTVQLIVSLPGKYVVGNDTEARRRMVVGPFYTNLSMISIYGQNISGKTWIQQFLDGLNICLTQTRKFDMLDRTFDTAVNAELKRLSGANANPADVVRLNQKLGTDYLVVGSVSFANVPAPVKNPYTGQYIAPASALFATINYRVIVAATGQLKWADSIKLDAARYAGSLSTGNSSVSAESGAAMVSAGIISCILPFEVVKVMSDGTCVIGEGGKLLQPGQVFSIYNQGEEVTDTRTGEVIDCIEERIGMVQIIRVTPKLSYAKLIHGKKEDVAVGSVLRRDAESMSTEYTIRMQKAVTEQPGTKPAAVNVPF